MPKTKANKNSKGKKKIKEASEHSSSEENEDILGYKEGDFVHVKTDEADEAFEIYLLKEDQVKDADYVKAAKLSKAPNEIYFLLPSEEEEEEALLETRTILGPARLQATECDQCFKMPNELKNFLIEERKDEEKKIDLLGDKEDGQYNIESIRKQKKKAKVPKAVKKLCEKEKAKKDKSMKKIGEKKDKKEERSEESSSEEKSKTEGLQSSEEDILESIKKKEPKKKEFIKKEPKKKEPKRKLAKEQKKDKEKFMISESSSEEISEGEESKTKVLKKKKKEMSESSNEDKSEEDKPKSDTSEKKKIDKKPNKMSKKEALTNLHPRHDLPEIKENTLLSVDLKKCSSKASQFPFENCSVIVSNREAIFHAIRGNLAGIKQMMKKSINYSTFFQEYSIDINKDAIQFAIEHKHFDVVNALLGELIKEINGGPSLKRATVKRKYFQPVHSGKINNYQFGFRTKQISMSRGEREGNNAFDLDLNLLVREMDILNILDYDIPFKELDSMIFKKSLISISQAVQKLTQVIRRGDHKTAYHLLKYAADHQLYNYSKLFYQSLEEHGEPDKVLKASVTKKSMQCEIMPLHVACINPNPAPLKKLLSVMPKYDAADKDGNKLVHYAAASVSDATLKYLASKKNIDLNTGNNRSMTPLMIACLHGRAHNVKLLLEEQQRQLKEIENYSEKSREEEEVDIETEKKSMDFVNTQTKAKMSALHYACEKGNKECVELLLDSGADANAKSSAWITPLMLACCHGHTEIVKLLIEKGKADALVKNKKGKSSLIFAVVNGQIQIVSYLIRHGINYDVGDSSNNTPLHFAAAYGWPDIVKYLVEAGADPNVMNSCNHPPASIALLKRHFGIATFLLQLPNINAKFVDEQGRNLAIQVIKKFSSDTLEQLKFLGDKTNVDFGSLDKYGMSVYHYLAMTEPAKNFEEENKAEEMEDIEDPSEEKPKEDEENIVDEKSEEKSPHDESKMNSEESKERESENEENMESESRKNDDFKPSANAELKKDKKRDTDNDSGDSDNYNDDEANEGENNRSEEKKTAMLKKAHNKLLITCAEYIKAKNSTDINTQNDLETTALLLAIENEYYDYALWLLENGSTIEGKVANRDNFIHLLINNMGRKGNFQLLRAAMNKFDDLSTSWKKLAIETDKHGKAPIHLLVLSIMRSNDNIKNMAMQLLKFLIEVVKVDCAQVVGPTKKGKKILEKLKKAGLSQEEINEKIRKRKIGFQEEYQKPRQIRNQNNNINGEEKMKKNDEDEEKYFVLSKNPSKYVSNNVGLSNILHLLCKYFIDSCEKNFNQVIELIPADIFKKMDTRCINGYTPLFTAIKANQEKPAMKLIELGFDVNATMSEKHKIACLHAAAYYCQSTNTLEALIKKGANVNAKDHYGMTPLFYAIKSKNYSAAQFLLQHGANVNEKDNHGITPLHLSAKMYEGATTDTMNMAELLLKNKANLTAKDENGQTPLFYCFKSQDFDIDPIALISLFLSYMSVEQINIEDNKRDTALHYACSKGAIISTMTLVKHGGKLDVKNILNNTPVAECFKYKRHGLSIYLLQHCAVDQKVHSKVMSEMPKGYLDCEILKELLKKYSVKRQSLFEFAAEDEKEGIIHMLLGKGYPIVEAVKDAIKIGKLKLAHRLFEQNEDKFKNYYTKKRHYNIHNYLSFKVNYGKVSDIELSSFSDKIISAGIDPLNKGINGETSLHAACLYQSVELLKTIMRAKTSSIENILGQKAKINIPVAKRRIGAAPFPVELSPVQSLFSYVENIDSKEISHIPGSKLQTIKKSKEVSINGNEIPLNEMHSMVSFIIGYSLKHNLILNLEIDLFPENQKPIKSTALNYAIMRKNYDLVCCLLAYGADINEEDSEGRTPLMQAVISNDNKILELLLNKDDVYRHKQKLQLDKEDLNKNTALLYCVENKADGSTLLKLNDIEMLIQAGADFSHRNNDGYSITDLISNITNNEPLIQQFKELNLTSNFNFPKLKQRPAKVALASHSISVPPAYDYNSDCEAYLEKKKVEKMDDETTIEVDKVFDSGFLAEVVKDEETKFHFDVLLEKIDIRKSTFGDILFYKMQLLWQKTQKIYILWTRWGKIGDDGQDKRTPFNEFAEAKNEYVKLFKQKTGNDWSKVENFTAKYKKYDLKELNGKAIFAEIIGKKTKFSHKNINMKKLMRGINFSKAPKSNLPTQLQELFIKAIDTKLLNENIKNHDEISKSLVLSSVDSKNVELAWRILNEYLAKAKEAKKIDNNSIEYSKKQRLLYEMYKLSNKYYQLIPLKTYVASEITNLLEEGASKYDIRTLSDLYDIEATFRIILGAKFNLKKIHPADYAVKALALDMDLITEKTNRDEFKFILTYINAHYKEIPENTRKRNIDTPQTFTGIYTILKIKSEIHKFGAFEGDIEDSTNKIFNSLHNHCLLWHGTSNKNLLGILSQGLRIALFSEKHSGQMYGTGIYFSDSFDQAVNYSGKNDKKKDEFIVMLLCEVALGNIYSFARRSGDLSIPPPSFHSLRLISKIGPTLYGMTPEGIFYPNSDYARITKCFFREKGVKYISFEDYELAKDKENIINNEEQKKGIGFSLKTKKRKFEEDECSEEEESENEEKDEKEKKVKNIEKFEKKFNAPDFTKHGIVVNELSEIKKGSEFTPCADASQFIVYKPEQVKIRYIVFLKNLRGEDEIEEEENIEENLEDIDSSDSNEDSSGSDSDQ